MPDDTLIDQLRLCMISGIGPRLRQALLERFGSAAAVLQAAPSALCEVSGVGAKLSRAISLSGEQVDVEAEIERCRSGGIDIVTDEDDRYPRMLQEIHDPPGVLFCRGTLLPQDNLAVAIVGARHATRYGITQSERLAGALARAGVTIVSGLARGIDGAAHRGALAAGGRTIAVLGSGLLNIYPPEHASLADEVAASGAIISEAPTQAKPLAGAFPQRNRLISGIALGTIVVEASERSGALITARHSYEQGREVFAVPGRVDSRLSQGCHRLIRDGAKLVETIDDVLEELGPLVEATSDADGQVLRHPAELQLNDMEQRVLQAIDTEPTLIDQVIRDSRLSPQQVLSTVSVLEMRRLVRRISGSSVARY
ncbi:MAG: DNA-protecting protein DprA [Planctomycetes bacterium]|nr:DNA-protecting protein DprA [Planctomycetota bacterium]